MKNRKYAHYKKECTGCSMCFDQIEILTKSHNETVDAVNEIMGYMIKILEKTN